jgi:hypothetical protein
MPAPPAGRTLPSPSLRERALAGAGAGGRARASVRASDRTSPARLARYGEGRKRFEEQNQNLAGGFASGLTY